MAGRRLEVEIIGDSRSLERAFGRASKSGSGLGRSLSRLGTVAAVGVGAAFAGLAATLKVGFDELSEGQKVAAQTAAALKSTGGVANVTARDVDKLAQSLSQMSGIDDELIQSGENLLLTFKNVRNEVGKGNAVFDRATKSALDLSVAGFGSVESASKMMGKALNDPIKGMTALGRAGVTFSEEQKKAIKALVETGDLLGAQKLILKEVESQVGGSAKAYGETLPGQLSKLKNSFEEVAGGVAETLLPYLMQLLDWTNRNMPTIQKVIQTSLNAVVATIEFLAPIISALIASFGRLAQFTRKHWGEVQEAAESVIAWYRSNVAPAIQNVVAAVEALWDRFGENIKTITRNTFGVIFAIVKTVLGNLASIVQTVLALLRGDWSKAWNEMKEIPERTLKGVLAVVRGMRDNFSEVARAIGGAIVSGMVAGLRGLAGQIRDLAVAAGKAFVGGIQDGLSALGSALASAIKAPINAVIRAWNALGVPGFNISIDMPKPIPDINFGWGGIGLPDIPQLAKGGPVRAGSPAIVGERGPELFVPGASGRIIPNGGGGMVGAASAASEVHVHFHGGTFLGGNKERLALDIRDALVRAGIRNSGQMMKGLA